MHAWEVSVILSMFIVIYQYIAHYCDILHVTNRKSTDISFEEVKYRCDKQTD